MLYVEGCGDQLRTKAVLSIQVGIDRSGNAARAKRAKEAAESNSRLPCCKGVWDLACQSAADLCGKLLLRAVKRDLSSGSWLSTAKLSHISKIQPHFHPAAEPSQRLRGPMSMQRCVTCQVSQDGALRQLAVIPHTAYCSWP